MDSLYPLAEATLSVMLFTLSPAKGGFCIVFKKPKQKIIRTSSF
jgi:hypothetical protein